MKISNTIKHLTGGVVFAFACLICGYGGYLLLKPEIVERSEKVVRTSVPQVTSVNLKSVPAVVDTRIRKGKAREVATYSATIDSGRVSVDIGVEYDEEANVFDLIKFRATAARDSVYVERIERVEVVRKPKLFGICGGVRASAARGAAGSYGLSRVGADLGVKILGKYSVTAGIDSGGEVSARVGIDF